jgi:4-amino-4-deoxy-L-arabinose transferase-like glycosyltransferase
MKWIAGLYSLGMGLGFLSLGQFLGYILKAPFVFPFMAAISIFPLFFWILNTSELSNSSQKRLSNELRWLLFLAIFIAILAFAYRSYIRPEGLWDAQAIWNLRAEFLFRSGLAQDATFSNVLEYSHLDYPLLLPTLIAQGWHLLGTDTPLVPIGIAALFTFGSLGFFFVAICNLVSVEIAAITTILLPTLPALITYGAGQYADVPLAFYILQSMTALVICTRQKETSRKWPLIAGVCAGCAAWTKNEGLLFAGLVMVALFIIDRRPIRIVRTFWPFLAGLVPFLCAIIYLKVQFAPTNDLIAGQGSSTLGRVLDFSRYFTIGEAFLRLGIFPAAAAIGVMLYLRLNRRPITRIPGFLLVTIGLLLLGYFFVYVVTPSPLEWHLETSLDRLFLHLWPLELLAISLSIIPVGQRKKIPV